MNIKRKFFQYLYGSPAQMESVQYWKTKEAVRAKLTKGNGRFKFMQMEGEKYPFPGFPRGYLLHGWEYFPKSGSVAKLKHVVKNEIFNHFWHKLEAGATETEIASELKERIIDEIGKWLDQCRHDMVPPDRLVPSVQELWRALTVVENTLAPEKRKRFQIIKDVLIFVIQEDDAYRMRLQWLIKFFRPRWWQVFKPITRLDFALKMLEHGEIVGDMKDRARLLRRVVMSLLKDKGIREIFEKLAKETDWKKLELSDADKYFFRGKWFKVDLDKFDY